jgi:hypothetical protein
MIDINEAKDFRQYTKKFFVSQAKNDYELNQMERVEWFRVVKTCASSF